MFRGDVFIIVMCMYEYKSKREKEERGEEKGEGTTKNTIYSILLQSMFDIRFSFGAVADNFF